MIMLTRNSKRQKMNAFLYMAPAGAFIGLIFLYPIIKVIENSFLERTSAGTLIPGLANYVRVFHDKVFWQAVINNGRLLISVPIMTILAIILAILLYEQIWGWRLYRTLIFLPYILAVPVVATTFVYILSFDGLLNSFFRTMGFGFLAKDWLGSPDLVVPSIGAVIIYRELGFGVVLFLARLLSIDQETIEAAEIDGANWIQKHVHITLPEMQSVLGFFIVTELITMLSWVFAYVYSMTNGGPGNSSTVMEFYIWKHAFYFQSPGIASALAVLLLLFTSIFIGFQLLLRNKPAVEA
jgi:ABC-type sugar transport system permease subunit